jgi:hypothetical protein
MFRQMSSSAYQDLLDAFFARKDRTIVERFVDAKFGEPGFGQTESPAFGWSTGAPAQRPPSTLTWWSMR